MYNIERDLAGRELCFLLDFFFFFNENQDASGMPHLQEG